MTEVELWKKHVDLGGLRNKSSRQSGNEFCKQTGQSTIKMSQIIAPVPHSTLIHTITRCAQSTICSNLHGDKFKSQEQVQTTNNFHEWNGTDFAERDTETNSLKTFLDFVDLIIDEEELMKVARDLGLENEKFELPDLKNVNETISLSCSR